MHIMLNPFTTAPGGGAMAGMRGLLSDPQAAQMVCLRRCILDNEFPTLFVYCGASETLGRFVTFSSAIPFVSLCSG